jgi:hypothetical protein
MSSPLTTAQLQTFKAAINSDPNLAAARAAGDQGAIAAYYNAAGTGNIWKPDIDVSTLNTAIVWAEFVALTVAKQNGYFAMTQGGNIDATSSNIRGGFTAVFGGTTSLTNLTALAQRVATRFEALFTTSQVCSLYGYVVTVADVAAALAS